MNAIRAFGSLGASAVLGSLLLLVLVLAALIAWRREDMRPIVYALAIVVACDVATFVLWSVVTPPKLGDPPLEGWRRVAGHVDHACFIASRAAPAAAAWRVLLGRRALPVWGAAAAALVVLVASYPAIRGASLASYYLALDVVLLVLAYRAILPWAARQLRTDDVASLPAVASAGLMIGPTTTVVSGPYRHGIFGAWTLAQFAHAIAFAAVALLLAAALAKGGGEPWRSNGSA